MQVRTTIGPGVLLCKQQNWDTALVERRVVICSGQAKNAGPSSNRRKTTPDESRGCRNLIQSVTCVRSTDGWMALLG